MARIHRPAVALTDVMKVDAQPGKEMPAARSSVSRIPSNLHAPALRHTETTRQNGDAPVSEGNVRAAGAKHDDRDRLACHRAGYSTGRSRPVADERSHIRQPTTARPAAERLCRTNSRGALAGPAVDQHTASTLQRVSCCGPCA